MKRSFVSGGLIPLTRKSLLVKMADEGYVTDVLKHVQKLINAEKSDLFDGLEFVAYAGEPIAREERANNVRKHIYPNLSDQQRDFIDFVLSQYIKTGVSELDIQKLSILMEMKFDTSFDGINQLGGAEIAKNTFVDFESYL